MVERQSAPFKNPVISVVPLEMAPSITLRWEMDLSPGIVISPRSPQDAGKIDLTFIDYVPVFLQQQGCFVGRILVVEFDSQNPFFKFPVVNNSNIFDIQIV